MRTIQTAIEAAARGETGIRLDNGDLTADDVRPLLDALKGNSSVTKLELGSIKLGDEGAALVADMLRHNSSIHTLDLLGNKIGDAGAVAIAEMLKENGSIHTLDLSDNRIRDAGVEAIAEMLKTNASLRLLRLLGNTCTAKGGGALSGALESNEALKNFSLPNGIPDDIVARIEARVTVIKQQYDDFGVKGLEMLNSNVKVRWGRARFMVVGKGAAGKSSFICTLLWQVPVGVHDSTIGVDLKLTRTRDWAEREADTADLDEQLAKAQFLMGAPALAPAPAPAPAVRVDEEAIAQSYRADLKAWVQQDGGRTVAEEVSFTIWDYGGQEVFYALHHLFLTSNGIYVLVFDMRELLDRERFAPLKPAKVTAEPPNEVKVGLFAMPQRRRQAAAAAKAAAEAAEAAAAAANAAADAQHRAAVEVYAALDTVEDALATLRFWLDSIALHAPDADVVLVGTHMDAVSRREDLEAVDAQLKSLHVHRSAQTVRNRADGLWFFPEDNMDRSDAALERVQRLRDVVVARVKDSDYVKREVPLRWALLLEKMLADKARNYMELGDVKELALDVCGIDADELTTQLLPFLHELGVVMHLTATPRLANIVVLRPQWLLDNLSRVICDPRHMDTHVETMLDTDRLPHELHANLARWEREGIAMRALLEWLWQGRNVDFFVDLMQQMLLGCPVDAKSGDLLVPSLLPLSPEGAVREALDTFGNGPLAYLQFAFLPRGVFHRFVTSVLLSSADDRDVTLVNIFAESAVLSVGALPVLLAEDGMHKRVHIRFRKQDTSAIHVLRTTLEVCAKELDANFLSGKLQPRLFLSSDGTERDDACAPYDDIVRSTDDWILSIAKRPLQTSAFSFWLPPSPPGPNLEAREFFSASAPAAAQTTPATTQTGPSSSRLWNQES